MNDNPQPPLSEMRAIIEQIASGLRAFHRMEMIHQDLKPENIMIDKHGTIKIIDFGSTKIAGLQEITTPLERINMLGTKNYTAPEYLLGYTGSIRSDLFSIGVIAYEILTGHFPYPESKLEKNPRPMTYISACHFNPTLPVWVDAALKKAVHPNPTRRYESLSEFLYDLSHPSPFPLREQNPVAFWRRTAIISLIINLILLYFALE
jgi:serine/threonine protein kinase